MNLEQLTAEELSSLERSIVLERERRDAESKLPVFCYQRGGSGITRCKSQRIFKEKLLEEFGPDDDDFFWSDEGVWGPRWKAFVIMVDAATFESMFNGVDSFYEM